MANEDKKYTELDPITVLGLEDIIAIVPADGSKTYRTTLQSVKNAIAGTDYGSEVFFGMGAPVAEIGRTIDIYFDLSEGSIYQKNNTQGWVKKVLFSKKDFEVTFTATAGQTEFTSNLLNAGTVKETFIDGFRNPVGYSVAGNVITFSQPINENCKVVVKFA